MKVVIDGVSYIKMPPEVKPTNLTLALDLRFDSNIGDNITIRDYLYNLLSELWRKAEGFSGKRPFGNSGWKHELYLPLIRHGLLEGSLEEGKYPL